MKIHGYGSEGYYGQQVQLAILKENLLREATAARLAKGEIKPDELALYREVLAEAESSVVYATEKNEEHKTKAREGAGADEPKTESVDRKEVKDE